MPTATVRRTALFVDFDNVYIGLRRLDEQAAELFARDPGRLVAWLENGVDKDDGPFRRRFLVRVCYLNPGPFSEFRAFYTSAGFRVVDTPSLTQQGKSAADTPREMVAGCWTITINKKPTATSTVAQITR